jgi:hypothetical protein
MISVRLAWRRDGRSVRRRTMDERPRPVVQDRFHERVRDADRHVEGRPARSSALGRDERREVRMIAAQDGHLRAAARAGERQRAAHRVEAVDRRACAGVRRRAALVGVERRHRREVVADSAAHQQRAPRVAERVRERRIDGPRARVGRHRERMDEAVDHRAARIGAGVREDAAGADRAALQVLEERTLALRAQLGRLGERQRARDALEYGRTRRLAGLRVALGEHGAAQRLLIHGGLGGEE